MTLLNYRSEGQRFKGKTKPRARRFINLAGALMGLISLTTHAIETKTQPNIVLVMVDDMGYSDLGMIGGDIETPNIDNLANKGLLFTQFYNNAKCSQTRASLLSGLYYHQTQDKGGKAGNQGYDSLSRNNNVTLAEVLKGAGYFTAMAGKWHIDNTPKERGFDKYYGFLQGQHSYWDSSDISGDYKPQRETFYTTDDFTDAGISFLDQSQKKDQPFFLYMAYNAPHFPLHAHPQDIEKYKGRFSGGWENIRQRRLEHMKETGFVDESFAMSPRLENRQKWDETDKGWKWDTYSAKEKAEQESLMEVYAAMVDRLDWNIGRIVNKLEELKVADNTLILFLSDNGGSAYHDKGEKKPGPTGSKRALNTAWAAVNSTPFKMFKRFAHEGGISTPMIAHWPAGIKHPGKQIPLASHIIDFMPTLVELSGAKYPENYKGAEILPMAGQSLAAAFEGTSLPSHKALFWEYQKNKAVREGDWKLVQNNIDRQWELYNIKTDRGETKNLSAKHPEMAKRLEAMWNEWYEKVDSHREVENKSVMVNYPYH